MTRYLYLPPVPRVRGAGGWMPQIRFAPMRRPPSPPQRLYRATATSQIGGYGVGQSVVSAGTATVRVGPSGVGTRWYPQQLTISTTSGVTDTSTCIVYLGPSAVPAAILWQSQSGGADVGGAAIPMMQPGDLITAVWSGAKNGDLATLRVIGDLQALVPG